MLAFTCRKLSSSAFTGLACSNASFSASSSSFKPITLMSLRHFARESFSSGGKSRVAGGDLKQTLRNILSKEATDTPYAYGRLAVAGGSVLGIGALCWYGLGLSKEAGSIDQAALWPQYVRDRINKTYMYLGGSLGITAGAAVAAMRSPTVMNLVTKNSMLALFGTLALMIGTGAVCRSIPYTGQTMPAKLLAWAAHCGTMGAILAPLCLMGGPIIVRAAAYTAGIVGGLSAVAVCAPGDKFLNMGGILGIGLGTVFVASIGTWFLPPTSMLGAGVYSFVLYGGLVLFAGFMLYDTQRLLQKAQRYPNYGERPYDPIEAQMSIYMNTLNIFIRMVMILGGAGGNRRK